LDAGRADIEGGVFLAEGFSAQGEVNFSSAQIGADIYCDHGAFTNSRGDALNVEHAVIKGSVFLRCLFGAWHGEFIGDNDRGRAGLQPWTL